MSVKMPKPVSKQNSRAYTHGLPSTPIIDLTTAPQKGKRALTSSTVSLMPVPIFMGR